MARGKILAVDDEKFFRKLYNDILSSEGYRVVTAESGEEALQLFAREPFDIVITDMAMKGMDGLQTMEAIKQINPAQDVVIVTGMSDVQMAVNAMKKGVADYILKPLNPEDFLHLIKTILEKQNLVAEHSKLISENLEYFGILSVYQRCLRILSILDMERLLEIILDSIMAETNAQGSVLWLFSPENDDLLKLATARGAVNISSEVDTLQISTHGQLGMIKTGKPFYDRVNGGEEAYENAFFIPLKVEERILGLVKVSDKLDRDRFEVKDLMIAKTIAGFASIAVENAWKVKEIEFKGYKDAKTKTYHINYFADYVKKEILKAGRYQRTFSILCLKIENYNGLRGDYKDSILKDAVQGVLNATLGVIRDADILAMSKNDEYYALLPETDYFGSLMTIRRINNVLKDKVFVSDEKKSRAMEIGLRSASFPKDGRDLRTLLEVVRRRTEEARMSLYTRYRLGEMDFWNIFERLVGKEDDYPLALIDGKASMKVEIDFEDDEGMGKFILFTPQVLSQVQDVILGEIEANTDSRGILYLGAKNMEQFLTYLGNHSKVESSATKIFLIGEKGEKGWELPNLTPVFVRGEEIEKVQFLIFLSVDYAYALLTRERGDGMYYGIHTSDPVFVENIIAKLQENYHLQVQL
ncbi:MAG: response receiver-modulated diguanylate cyclase [Deltaproteobacteria bacterium]|nr:response receiver-modulated diguanylate cyclase [Deltaproteobacteria bacterium]